MQSETVAVITVTYNRAKTLVKCLQSLLNQTRKPEYIIIVDNNSRLEDRNVIKNYVKDKDNILVLWLSDNYGGAGGFERGMKEAKRRYDPNWYWVMDDDAYPRRDCLEILLEQSKKIKNVGGLAPAIFGIDLQQYQMYHHKKLSPILFEDIPIGECYNELSDVTKIDANAFVGPLFSKKAVEMVGVADGSLFIYGDDTEYTYRVSRSSNIYLVKKAIIDHQDPPIVNNYLEPRGWWKDYYRLRNRFFLYQEFHTKLFKKIYADICMALIIFRLILAAIVKPKYKGYRKIRIWILTKSLLDGLKNKRGRRLEPEEYLSSLQSAENANKHLT